MTFYISPMRQRYMRRLANVMVEPELRESASEVFFPMDVKVEDNDYVITAVLPGVAPEELSIEVIKESVSLKGEFKVEREDGAEYLIRERPSGRFNRVITLPDEVDADQAEARVENGILTLRLPKSEKTRPRTIKINNN